MIAIRLNLPGSTLLRGKSGLDTRGSNSSVLLFCVNQQGNFQADGNVLLFLESTRELRLGVGNHSATRVRHGARILAAYVP